MREIEVLIVGAGPVGLTVAIECARRGLSLGIIDRLPEPSDQSRALVIWSAAQEVFSALGVFAEIERESQRALGLRICHGQRLLLHLTPEDQAETLFRDILILPQNDTERILTTRLHELGGHVERGVELTALTQDDLGVTARLRKSDGAEEMVRAKYVVGCDGFHSFVRHEIEEEFVGTAVKEVFLLCDAEIEGENPGFVRDEVQVFQSTEGPLPIFPMPGNLFRLVSTRRSEAGLEAPTLEEMQRHLDARGPGGLTLKNTKWLSTFRVSEKQVDRYVVGRVMLAGDASHVHSPSGGQGMNTGIQDAFNLGWKLAVILRHGGNPALLLESYHAERKPVAARVIARSLAEARMNILRGQVMEFFRDNLLWLAGRAKTVLRAQAQAFSGLDMRYRESPILDSDEEWDELPSLGFAPGMRVRDVALFAMDDRREVSLFRELQSTDHVLLIFSGREPRSGDVQFLDDLREHAQSLGLPLRMVNVWAGDDLPKTGEWLLDPACDAHERYGIEQVGYYVVRPDGYVALRVHPATEEPLDEYVRRLLA